MGPCGLKSTSGPLEGKSRTDVSSFLQLVLLKGKQMADTDSLSTFCFCSFCLGNPGVAFPF